MQEVGVHTLNWIEKLRKEYPIVVKLKNGNEKTKNSELDNKSYTNVGNSFDVY